MLRIRTVSNSKIVVQENMGRASLKVVRIDLYRIGVKTVVSIGVK